MGIIITRRGYKGHSNPVCDGHETVGVHYTWQNTVTLMSSLEVKSTGCPGSQWNPDLLGEVTLETNSDFGISGPRRKRTRTTQLAF